MRFPNRSQFGGRRLPPDHRESGFGFLSEARVPQASPGGQLSRQVESLMVRKGESRFRVTLTDVDFTKWRTAQ